MFFITLGDVLWILLAIGCVGFFIFCFFADKIHQNSKFKKPEDKPAPKVEPKKEAPKVKQKHKWCFLDFFWIGFAVIFLTLIALLVVTSKK